MNMFAKQDEKERTGEILAPISQSPLTDSIDAFVAASDKAIKNVAPTAKKLESLDAGALAEKKVEVARVKDITAKETIRQEASKKTHLGFIQQAGSLADREQKLNQMNPIKRHVLSIFSSEYRNQDLREDKQNLANHYGVFQAADAVGANATLTDLKNVATDAAATKDIYTLSTQIAAGKLQADMQNVNLLNGIFGAHIAGMKAEQSLFDLDASKRELLGSEMDAQDVTDALTRGQGIEVNGVSLSHGQLVTLDQRKRRNAMEDNILTIQTAQLNDAQLDHVQTRYLADRNKAELQQIARAGNIVTSGGKSVEIRPTLLATRLTEIASAEEAAADKLKFTTGNQLNRYEQVGTALGNTAEKVLNLWGENTPLASQIAGVHSNLAASGTPTNEAEGRKFEKTLNAASADYPNKVTKAVKERGYREAKENQVTQYLLNATPSATPDATTHIAQTAMSGGFPEGIDDNFTVPMSEDGLVTMNIGRPLMESLQIGQQAYVDLLNEGEDQMDQIDIMSLLSVSNTPKAMDPVLLRKVSDTVRQSLQSRIVDDVTAFAPRYAGTVEFVSESGDSTPQPHPFSRIPMGQWRSWTAQAKRNAKQTHGDYNADQLQLELINVMNAHDGDKGVEFSADFASTADAYSDFMSSRGLTDKVKSVLGSMGQSSPIGFSAAGDWQRGFNASIDQSIGNTQQLHNLASAAMVKDKVALTQLWNGSLMARSKGIAVAIGAEADLDERIVDDFVSTAVKLSSDIYRGSGGVNRVPVSEVMLTSKFWEDPEMKQVQREVARRWVAKGRELDRFMSRQHISKAEAEKEAR